MIYRLSVCVVCVGIFCGASPAAEEEAPALETLESLVSQWVALRKQIADERHAGEDTRRHLARETELFEAEKTALEETVKKAGTTASTSHQHRVDLLQRRDELRKALSDLLPALDKAEAEVQQWGSRIPPSLAGETGPLLDPVPATAEQAARLPVTRRLQVLLSLFTRLETLQHSVHVTRELLPDVQDRKREVDVLYLGLARGFAVSTDNSWSAVGTPGDDGWTWTFRRGLGPDIRTAIQVFNRHSEARLVTLPLQAAPDRPTSEGAAP